MPGVKRRIPPPLTAEERKAMKPDYERMAKAVG